MEWSLSLPLQVYLGIVALVALASLLWMQTFVRSTRRTLERHLRNRKLRAPLATSSPLDDPTAAAREHGLESIRKQFSVTKRVAIPIIIGLASIAAGLPFLSRVPAAFLSLLAAAVTVLFGIAARPAVENAIAGVVIARSKLFNIGDNIRVDDQYGTIEDVTTTHTTIKLWDWRRYVIPNSAMLQTRLINYTLFDPYVWSYTELWVSPDTDLDKLRQLAIEVAKESKYFARHEEPQMWVMGMEKDSIRCWVAAWADSPGDGWMLSADIREGLARRFVENGMTTQAFRIIEARLN